MPLKLADYFPEMQGWSSVDNPAQPKPQIPNPETQVSPYLSTPLPLPMQYSGDSVKQYNRPRLSSFRLSPLPPNANPAINAAAQSVAVAVAAQNPTIEPGVTAFTGDTTLYTNNDDTGNVTLCVPPVVAYASLWPMKKEHLGKK